jgi:hypothetical protein
MLLHGIGNNQLMVLFLLFILEVNEVAKINKLCTDMDPCVKVGGKDNFFCNTSRLSSRFTILNSYGCFSILVRL